MDKLLTEITLNATLRLEQSAIAKLLYVSITRDGNTELTTIDLDDMKKLRGAVDTAIVNFETHYR